MQKPALAQMTPAPRGPSNINQRFALLKGLLYACIPSTQEGRESVVREASGHVHAFMVCSCIEYRVEKDRASRLDRT